MRPATIFPPERSGYSQVRLWLVGRDCGRGRLVRIRHQVREFVLGEADHAQFEPIRLERRQFQLQ